MTLSEITVRQDTQYTVSFTLPHPEGAIAEELEGVGDTMAEALFDLSQQLQERDL